MVEIVTILGSAIVVLAAAIPLAATYYNKSKIYLEVIKEILELVQEYLKSRADGTFTESEYSAIGKRVVDIILRVDKNPQIPLTLKI